MPDIATLPTLAQQAEKLIALGIARTAGIPPEELAALTAHDAPGALLVIHHNLAPASALVPLVRCGDKAAFVVVDMPDVDEFAPIGEVAVPASSAYVVEDVARGDQMANWSPNEALPAIAAAGRTPLTLNEGLHWLLQQPAALERGRCFMTIGSRKVKPNNDLDARTPAIWLSNGTGRDGATNRNAPKVGWCWAGNRHTWLGFASAARRRSLPSAGPLAEAH